MDKILSVHQPNYIPWLGYFHKILKSDLFILFDNVLLPRGSSVANRNKIRDRDGNEILLSVPVKKENEGFMKYNEAKIDYLQNWQTKHLKSIQFNYSKAKFFNQYFEEVSRILNKEYTSLGQLNIEFIRFILKEIKIETEIILLSEIQGDFGSKNDLIINLCKHFNANVYLSGHGAKAYNDENMYISNKIKLIYTEFINPTYPQIKDNFISNLSILDALFNCGGEETKKIIE